MEKKVFDSELKLLELLWRTGDISAKDLSALAKNEIGWSKTTTYTMIKRCMEKGIVERNVDEFICRAIINREEVQQYETDELIKKMYDGSADKLIASLMKREKLSDSQIEKLKDWVNKFE